MKCNIIFLIFILGWVAILSSSRIWDLDIWIHLKTGEYILKNLKIPKADIYSYTSEGHPWFNADWLFGVVNYLFYKFGGMPGLVILRIVVFSSIFSFLFFFLYKQSHNYLLSIILLFFAILVSKERIVERPEMFSFLFALIYLYIIFKFRKENTKLIWMILPLQIIWVNLHIFAILGIIFLWIYIFAEYINLKVKLVWEWNNSSFLDKEKFKILLCVGLWTIIFTSVNPWGIKIFKEYFSIFNFAYRHLDIFPGGIVELRPPFIEGEIFGLSLIYYKILILISQFSFILNYRRINLGNLFLYFLFLYFSLLAIRNVAFFAIVTMPMVMENLGNFFKGKNGFLKFAHHWKKIFIAGTFYSLVILGCIYFSLETIFSAFTMDGEIQNRLGFRKESPIHPKEAIDFILKNNIRGNGFNNFGFGSYFIWRAWPKLKVFVDGRTGVYTEDHLQFYAEVFLYPYTFEQLVKDYDLNYFLLDINSSKVLLGRLMNDKNWRLVFFDAKALVFVKNSEENKSVIEKYAIDFNNWQDSEPEMEIKTFPFRQKRIYPLSYFKKAVFFDLIGRIDLARFEYERAIKVNPYLGELYNNLGATYQAEGNLEKALDYYENALLVNPDLPSTHANLGFIYEKLGEKEKAIREYKMATSGKGGLSAEAHNNLGCIYFEKGLYRKALKEFSKAIGINRARAEYHFNLGSVFQAMGQIESAISAYRETIQLEPENVKAYNNLGFCYLAKGENQKARRAFEKVLEIEPENETARENLEKINNATK
ncbi:MAG: tetratricopeptide repeat protein [Candidatus Omnitrophica bacterium]|nr:tetratricopeptide repeat protein [Candidatus Omnitrophota bacterium]